MFRGFQTDTGQRVLGRSVLRSKDIHGFASYELVRGPRWLELLNPAEVFAAAAALHSTTATIHGTIQKTSTPIIAIAMSFYHFTDQRVPSCLCLLPRPHASWPPPVASPLPRLAGDHDGDESARQGNEDDNIEDDDTKGNSKGNGSEVDCRRGDSDWGDGRDGSGRDGGGEDSSNLVHCQTNQNPVWGFGRPGSMRPQFRLIRVLVEMSHPQTAAKKKITLWQG
ncbi:hypothetical protein EDB85DRAFT_1893872 [Lactarius pseudohatsudake]|nr:hypothetical protein EDB85DRAFT_1893872 [Lactarius pseudohatsudake]